MQAGYRLYLRLCCLGKAVRIRKFIQKNYRRPKKSSFTGKKRICIISPSKEDREEKEVEKNRCIREVPSRQIHLDFHTSGDIKGVCADFDAEEFASTLREAHVNSVTLFSCCHHGMLYYDSKKYPDMVHPHLVHRDLLREQAEACHRHGIQVNLYTTIRWNKRAADLHPEWICIDENGALQDYKGLGYFEPGFYKNLCVNTGYRGFLKEQFAEVLETIPAEGVWFDAAFMNECCCTTCRKMMREQGLDPWKKEDRIRFARLTYYDMVKDLTAFAKSFNPDYHVCYNKGHVGYLDKPAAEAYTYFSFESLPGQEWGYLDFPVSAKYMRNLGKECLGLTSRFHTEWGDFHAFRNQAALEYEVFSMLANGCKCTIGDQMDYWGVLNKEMYRRIGEVYRSVEEKEPWCEGADPVTEIGVFTAEEFYGTGRAGEIPGASEGAARMLMELSVQFDFIDSESEFAGYRLLLLPDVIPVDEKLKGKLQDYLRRGGKVICTGESGLDPQKKGFRLEELGVRYRGKAPYSPDFIRPALHLAEGLADAEHVMYDRGTWIEACGEAQFIQMAVRPVFNRERDRFCSHLHSPSAREECYPAVVGTPQTAYFIHPVFSTYQKSAPHWYKQLFKNELQRLLPVQMVSHNGPSGVVTNLMEQEKKGRQILHVLYYIPERKCRLLDIVEDVVPLYNLEIRLRKERRIQRICCVPSMEELPFREEEQTVEFVIPKITGHQMCVIDFEE